MGFFVIKDDKLRVECSPLLEFLLSIIPAIRYDTVSQEMRRLRQGQILAHNEGNTFSVKARCLRRNFSNFTCNSLLHCYCIQTKQDCRNQLNSDTHFMFAGREGTN